MMPAFGLSEFLDQSIIVWTDHPIYALLFAGACCVRDGRDSYSRGRSGSTSPL